MMVGFFGEVSIRKLKKIPMALCIRAESEQSYAMLINVVGKIKQFDKNSVCFLRLNFNGFLRLDEVDFNFRGTNRFLANVRLSLYMSAGTIGCNCG